jgi:hypothetical protein
MNLERIPRSEIIFHPSSLVDPAGKLFWHKGDLYRGIIRKKTAEFYRRLFEEGIIQDLIDKGYLIESELTDMELEGYELVIRHRCLPFVSYPNEWCAAMLKDAALLLIDLKIELYCHGLTVKDEHPWNILFDGCSPRFVDFGSINRDNIQKSWKSIAEFRHFFIYPLYLMSYGHERIARWLLHDKEVGVLESDVCALTNLEKSRFEFARFQERMVPTFKGLLPEKLHPLARKCLNLYSKAKEIPIQGSQSKIDFMKNVRRIVEDIGLPSDQMVLRNCDNEYHLAPPDKWTRKDTSINEIILTLRPYSLLDIRCKQGQYSKMAANLGTFVVALDEDPNCISRLYLCAKKNNLSILPLIVDLLNPTPGAGLSNQQYPPAIKRLRCDIVLFIGSIHHLVFNKGLDFEHIIDCISSFVNKWLLIEFIPKEDQELNKLWSERYSWYTQENLISIIQKKFKTVKIYPSDPGSRTLLLCEV